MSFFPFHLVLCLCKASGKMQDNLLDSMQVTMRSREWVVKQNSVSQTSRVQRVQIKDGRGAYTESPWRICWNPSSSRTTSGPLESSRVFPEEPTAPSDGADQSLLCFVACMLAVLGTCWFHALTTIAVDLLSHTRPLIVQSLWSFYGLDHFKNLQDTRLGWKWKKRGRRRVLPPPASEWPREVQTECPSSQGSCWCETYFIWCYFSVTFIKLCPSKNRNKNTCPRFSLTQGQRQWSLPTPSLSVRHQPGALGKKSAVAAPYWLPWSLAQQPLPVHSSEMPKNKCPAACPARSKCPRAAPFQNVCCVRL